MSEEYALSIRAADGSSHTYEGGTVTHIHLHSGSGREVGYIGDLGKGGIWIDVGRTALFMPADVVAAIADYVTAKEWAALSDEYEKEGTTAYVIDGGNAYRLGPSNADLQTAAVLADGTIDNDWCSVDLHRLDNETRERLTALYAILGGTFRVMCQNTWNGATQEVDDHIILSEN